MEYTTHYHGPHRQVQRVTLQAEELHAEYNGNHYWVSGVRHVDVPVHEVMVFKANPDGSVNDWIELYCVRNTTDTVAVFTKYLKERLQA